MALWQACESSLSEDGEFVVQMPEAESLQDCANACIETDGCTAILDYFWLGVDYVTCAMVIGPCDSPIEDPGAEVVGHRHYRKVCEDPLPSDAMSTFPAVTGTVVDPDSGCVFKATEIVCELEEGKHEAVPGIDDVDACLSACQEREDCVGIHKRYPISDEPVCLLLLAPCVEAESPIVFGYFFEKSCDE